MEKMASMFADEVNDADDEQIPAVQLTEQQRKREKRMKLNRESAKRSRQNRRVHIAAIEAKIATLSQEVQDLQTACNELEADNISRGSLFWNL